MKKKIINGIMMVALLFATVTSFVSCKDNDEDLKIDVTAALLPDIQKAQQDITNLQTSKADASTVTTLSGQLTTLQNTVNNLKYATPEQFQSLKDELAAIQAHIKDLVYALENMVTSVTVNATATTILPNSKVFPGINAQFIGAAYGEPVKPAGEFPSTDASLYVDGNALPAALIAGDTYSWDESDKYIGVKDNFAGKVYFTLNPSNVDPANLKGLKLVNSKKVDGKQVEVATLGTATECTDELTWGQTRAIGYDQNHEAKLWVADATMDVDNVKQAIDLKQMVDFKSIKNSVETMINSAKTSGVKTAGKTVLQESAKIAANLVTAQLPSMTAVALKAEWNDTIGTRSVLSDYSIAATAYKPLSFAEFKDVQFTANTDLSTIDNAVYKFANKFKKTINNIIAKVKKTNVDFSIDLDDLDPKKFNVEKTIYVFVRTGEETAKDGSGNDVKVVTIKKIYFSTDDEDLTGKTNIAGVTDFAANKTYYTTVKVGEDLTDEVAKIKKAVEGGIDTSSINDLLKEAITSLRDVKDGVDDIASLADRVTDYLSTIINKSINFIGTGRVLEPILLVNTDNGIQRATGNYTAGTYTFIPTTLNYEVLAPAYKKYIAVVDANGDVRYKTLKSKGEEGFKNLEVELKANDTKIVYAAMDFRGYQIAKVYDITVK